MYEIIVSGVVTIILIIGSGYLGYKLGLGKPVQSSRQPQKENDNE